MDFKKLSREFKDLQEARVREYKRLDSAHSDYLKSYPDYDLNGFQDVVTDVTEEFKNISNRILEIKKESLETEPKFSEFIEKIQTLEQRKLFVVVDYQLAAQQVLDEGGDELCEKNAKSLSKLVDEINSEISETMEEFRYFLAEREEEESVPSR